MATRLPGLIEEIRLRIRSSRVLLVLFGLHAVIGCLSLIEVAQYQSYIRYDGAGLFCSVITVAALSSVSLLFVLARFSLGYFVGFYFYTMIQGFLWIDVFSSYAYDHTLAGFSAAASLLLFLFPALLIDAPLKWKFELSPRSVERLLTLIMALSLATVVAASFYSFRIVSLENIYDYRDKIEFPTILRYLIGITSSSLLPFAFASYAMLNRRWSATATLLIMMFFYPVTLSKYAFFAPALLVVLLVATKFFRARTTVILSLLVPMSIGVIVVLLAMAPFGKYTFAYFNLVNIRMIATPASAMDIYNDFFAHHPLTHFCQISFLKPLTHCPYQEQISAVMHDTYDLGYLNASLFATEGVASVGLILAPLVALACGLVIALGNRLSAGLPHRFILVSGALLPQAFLNVPLTTALLTHGALILFLLWCITPRAMFEGDHETGRE